MSAIAKRLKNQKGQTAVEYALISIVLLAIVAAAIATPLQNALQGAFQRVETDVAAIDPTPAT